MSSLQCPATLLLASHAEPVDSTGLGPTGRDQAADLADRLAGRRVCHVWTGPARPAAQTAEIVAERLGVGVTTRDALDVRPEAGLDVVAPLREVLDEVADAHPGETVLVVGHGDAFRLAVPGLARMEVSPAPLEPCDVVELEADADGRVCRAWGTT